MHGSSENNSSWHSDKQIPEIVAHSPLAIKSKLTFLKNNAGLEQCSPDKLSKFGLLPPSVIMDLLESSSAASRRAPIMERTNIIEKEYNMHGNEQSMSPHSCLPHNLVFGSFQSRINEHIDQVSFTGNIKMFQGINFMRSSWHSIP